MEMPAVQRASRLAAARLALVRAEERAGLTSVLTRQVGHVLDGSDGQSGNPDRSRPGVLDMPLESGVTAVLGSASLLLALAARAQGAQGWCAVVGWPDLGWCAAAEAGLDLTRVLVVPWGRSAVPGRPGVVGAPLLLPVLGVLVDGVDLLVLGGNVARALRPRDRRTLLSRARSRGTHILVATPWEGARVLQAQVHSVEDGRGGEGQGERPARDDGVVVPLRPLSPAGLAPEASVESAAEMPAGFLQAVTWEVGDAARAGRPERIRVGVHGARPEGATPGGAAADSALSGTG